MNFYRKTVLSILFSIGFLFSAFGIPDNEFIQQLTSLLEQYTKSQAQEKVYLHLNKPYYVAGEDIWYKAYLVYSA